MKVYVSRTYEPESIGVARAIGWDDQPYCIIYNIGGDGIETFTVRLHPDNPNHCESVRELARHMGVAVAEVGE